MGEGGGCLATTTSELLVTCERNEMLLRLGIALVLCVHSVSARRYVVGDDSGWNTGVNYSAWTTGKSFFVGDALYFDYLEADHNLLQVDSKAFKTCNITATISSYTSGDSTVDLASTGVYYFVCGVGDHCLEGQKLQVFVYFQYTADAPASLVPASNVSGYLLPVSGPSFYAPDRSSSSPKYLCQFLLLGCWILPLMIPWLHY